MICQISEEGEVKVTLQQSPDGLGVIGLMFCNNLSFVHRRTFPNAYKLARFFAISPKNFNQHFFKLTISTSLVTSLYASDALFQTKVLGNKSIKHFFILLPR